MPSLIEPGMRVRHPDRPDWGVGQVQSVIGDRITVNFENAGKVLVNAALIALEILDERDRAP
jgi:transcription elongation factor GreA-like protein